MIIDPCPAPDFGLYVRYTPLTFRWRQSADTLLTLHIGVQVHLSWWSAVAQTVVNSDVVVDVDLALAGAAVDQAGLEPSW